MKEFSQMVGRAAVSKAGRDKGRLFIILEVSDGGHVLIADGKLRKMERPKRKKLMHLRLKPVVFEHIVKLYADGQLKNSDIRSALATIEQSDDESIKEDTACPSKT
ncbi:MAG: RNA-binding protein [Christensenellales bacterium]|jgi:large subunit ribosomal protein L14e